MCTKCLPDVLPNVKLLEDTLASDQIGSYHLMQVCTSSIRAEGDQTNSSDMMPQNGLGIEEDLFTALEGREIPILSSCAWIGIMTSSDGQVVSWRGQVRIDQNLSQCVNHIGRTYLSPVFTHPPLQKPGIKLARSL